MAGRITFGYGMITGQRHPHDPQTNAELYKNIIDLCVHAETLRFDSVWLSEHHFVDDGYMSGLLPVAAAIAARTNNIRIGTGIMVAPLHNPIRLAEDAATVDLLSTGRLVLGIGAGYREEEFSGFGKTKENLGASLDRTLEVLRGSWAPGIIKQHESASQVSVTPKPHQRGGPPIWIGARTSGGIRRTARLADGLLAARVTPDELNEQVSKLVADMDDCGRSADNFEIGVHMPVLAWPERAWDVLEPYLHYSEWKYKDMVGTPYGKRPGKPGLPPKLSEDSRESLRSHALVGTPEMVAQEIRRYWEAVGDLSFHFIPRLYWPGMPLDVQYEAISIFANEVIPLVGRDSL